MVSKYEQPFIRKLEITIPKSSHKDIQVHMVSLELRGNAKLLQETQDKGKEAQDVLGN